MLPRPLAAFASGFEIAGFDFRLRNILSGDRARADDRSDVDLLRGRAVRAGRVDVRARLAAVPSGIFADLLPRIAAECPPAAGSLAQCGFSRRGTAGGRIA